MSEAERANPTDRVRDFYQGNKLIKGEVVLGGRPIKLENITANLLVVYATLDHIVPDVVHVMSKGRVVKSGGKELALELEANGYAQYEAA